MKKLIFSAFILASVCFFSCSSDDDDNRTSNYQAKDFFQESQNSSKQIFQVTASETKTLELEGGTKITIKPNTFTKDGVPVTGKVTVEVKEMLKRSDMIASGANTNYVGQQILASDGFFYIDAKQNGVSLDKNLAKNLFIEIPKEGTDARLTYLWEGTEKAGEGENQFAWKDLPEDALAPNDVDGPVGIKERNMVWANQGSTTFAFSLGKLGWFNCDIFWTGNAGMTTVNVTLTGFFGQLASYQGYTGDTFVFFCGKGEKVIAQLYTLLGNSGVKSYDNSMPIGKEGKMIAFSIKDGKYYFDSKNITITANLTLTLNLQETTKENIQQQFESLDNFN